MKTKVLAVAGPTGCGKTALSIELAKKNNGEIISADSRLVYKEFNIAAAKPTEEERQGIPHYMIDIIEPEEDYSVACYCDEAKKLIYDISKRGKLPIVCGGTGLYLKVLLEDYSIPRVEADINFREEKEKLDKEILLEELKSKDIITYEKLKGQNKRRIIRALEVMNYLKVPFSEIEKSKEPEFDVEWICPPLTSRAELYDRINKRVDNMVSMGIVEETQNLLKKHGRIKNIVETIGYREIIEYLDGRLTLKEAVEALKQHTRNYAKRQLTWFRRNPQLEILI